MIQMREVRKKQGKTVEEIAKILNVSKMAIYHYETGKRKISILQLKKLATFFNCDINDLI